MKRLTRWFLRLITGRDMLAVTVAQRVFLLYDVDDLFDRLGPSGYRRLMTHERVHVEQQRREGIAFYWRYLVAHVKHGYEANPYEVEARELAGER